MDYFVEALSYTTILLKFNDPEFDPFGSGVLLGIENDIFLVTAGHVLTVESWLTLSMPGAGETMINLRHAEVLTSMPEGGNSKMDIAILKFGINMHKYIIDHYNILTLNDILIGYKPQPQETLLMTGYPVTKFKKVNSKNFEFHPYKLSTRIKNHSLYAKLELEEGCYILTEYSKKVLDDQNKKFLAPDLYGVSGSGLWALTKNGVPKLIGINTEFSSRMSYLISIRIDIVLSILKNYYYYKTIPNSPFACLMGNVYKIELPEGTDLYNLPEFTKDF